MGSVVQSYAATLAATQAAAVLGPGKVRRPPIAVQSTVLFNPQGSYELRLVALIHPALLHLIFMVAVAGALGRELRDGTIGDWIGEEPRLRAAAAVAGKLAPISRSSPAGGCWRSAMPPDCAAGRSRGAWRCCSPAMSAMYLAYVGVTLLVVGLTLTMGKALSVAGLYAGASFAFAGAIFPIGSASGFARLWTRCCPIRPLRGLLAEQWIMGAPAGQSLWQILAMLAFLLVGGGHRAAALSGGGAAAGKLGPEMIGRAFLATFRAIFADSSALMLLIGSCILYAFFYPSAYSGEVPVRMPVAVVDMDHSGTSRATDEPHRRGAAGGAGLAPGLARRRTAPAPGGARERHRGDPRRLRRRILAGGQGMVSLYGQRRLSPAHLDCARRGSARRWARRGATPRSTNDGAGRARPPPLAMIRRPLFNTREGYGSTTSPASPF